MVNLRKQDGPSADEDRDARRPAAVYGVGSEPDARFSLANERTALAWVRTGLGLVAGGVALTSFSTFAEVPVLLEIVAAIACLAGASLAVYALRSWKHHEIALRTGSPLPAPTALPLLVGGVVAMALLLTGYAIASILG
ncbi:putative membrane protein [Sanguibacter gelidistatuariae]|uniref:Putative membrane protein n=1 Tax=Sanguibacter gelidistatuariae TaxID=1814289 RepID=A0A1G6MJ40_9MICO|nr:DUF202 domain-containing protein [Sanguibacter gelidistatuariae]SDC55533.1 putative membrane protein [Sanguibacter gelidistatuariae]